MNIAIDDVAECPCRYRFNASVHIACSLNGDASGLTDEEISMVNEAIRKNNIEIVSPRYNEDMCTEPYFSHCPFFGLPTEVEDCDIIYHEYQPL